MKDLKNFWRKSLSNYFPTRSVIVILLGVYFLAFLDSLYLALSHLNQTFPPCSITYGCEKVLISPYATVFGIPLSFIGVTFSFSLLICFFSLLIHASTRTVFFIILMSILGLINSIILFLLQVVVLHAFCQYCVFFEGLVFIGNGVLFFPLLKAYLFRSSST